MKLLVVFGIILLVYVIAGCSLWYEKRQTKAWLVARRLEGTPSKYLHPKEPSK